MSGLDAKISGDWFDIREVLTDIHRLQDILLPNPEFVRHQQHKLMLCVEEGTIEYKRAVLLQGFAELEDANYRTFQMDDYRGIELAFQFLTFLSLLQRSVAAGRRKTRPEPRRPPTDQPVPEIKQIMHEIRSRIRSDASYRRRPPVKNILMQIQKYSREVDSLKKLIRTAPEDKKPAYVRNFRNFSQEIFSSIKRQYAELLKEEAPSHEPSAGDSLSDYDLKPVLGVLMAQAEVYASLWSSLVYARTREQRVRESVVALANRREETLATVELERRVFERVAGTDATELACAFARELVALIDDLF